MKIGRDYVAEIEAKRARGRRVEIPGAWRVELLSAAFERSKEDAELRRYFPLAVIAVIEGSVRSAVQRLIDEKPGCFEKFLTCQWSREQKFDLSVLQAVSGKRISVGELISHLVTVKSVDNVIRVLSDVLGQSVVPLLQRIHDRWSVEVECAPKEPMISDLDGVLAALAAAFKHRHILAHEPADGLKISVDEVADELRAAAAFVGAVDQIVSQAIHPDAPLTQNAMNRAAADQAQAADDELQAALRAAPKSLEKRADFLADVQEKWTEYRAAQAQLEGLAFEGGSIRPMIEAGARCEMARSRLTDIRRLFANWEPEGKPSA